MNDRAVVEEYLRRAAALDPDAYAEIWAEDGRLEMPFHPDPDAREVVGRDAIRARMAVAAEVLRSLEWVDPVILATEQPGRFVLEMRSEAHRHDGEAYRNRYVVVAEARDGRMVLWREYFAPAAVAEASEARRPTG